MRDRAAVCAILMAITACDHEVSRASAPAKPTTAQSGEATSDTDGPKMAGECLSEGQVQNVVQVHMVAVRRACWERSQITKSEVNVNVRLTVAADGSAQGVTVTGDDANLAQCIDHDVRTWRFPAIGCTQRVLIPFKFLLQ